MESSSRIKDWISSATDYLNEQTWYQELRTKWEELDPQSRIYLQFAAFGSGVALAILMILSAMWSVHRLKAEVRDKQALLNMVQTASDEMRRLKDALPPGINTSAQEGAWQGYFEGIATNAVIDKSALTLSPEKAGASANQSKEVLFDVGLKHINVKQLVRFTYALENGTRPVKLRNLLVDTKGDSTGYMDATLSVSAFSMVVPK